MVTLYQHQQRSARTKAIEACLTSWVETQRLAAGFLCQLLGSHRVWAPLRRVEHGCT